MASKREVIFDELEIDTTNIISDPVGFSEQVYTAAENLREILKADNSVGSYLSSLPKGEYDMGSIKKVLDGVYYQIDEEVPTVDLEHVAKLLRKLASDVEFLAKRRAMSEIAMSVDKKDKGTAHAQYKKLREKFADLLKAWKMLVDDFEELNIQPLAPMPGNYGSDSLFKHYVFRFEGDDDDYLDFMAVARRLELPRPKNLMEVVEYIRDNPDKGVEVKEVEK